MFIANAADGIKPTLVTDCLRPITGLIIIIYDGVKATVSETVTITATH